MDFATSSQINIQNGLAILVAIKANKIKENPSFVGVEFQYLQVLLIVSIQVKIVEIDLFDDAS